MTVIAYLLAGLILLVRVYVPINSTVLGGWPVRLLLFLLWYYAITSIGGNNLGQFYRTLKSRRAEMKCYAIWLAILAFFWLTQGGQQGITSFLLTAYIGTIPFYFLGTYYSVNEGKGRGMAVAIGIVMGASCLQAIPVVWQNPELVRMGAIDLTPEIRSQGIGSYGDLTGFACMLSFFLVASLESKHLVRIIGVASCVATMTLLMISTFSGVILLTGMSVVGCVLYYLLLGGFRLRRIILASTAILGIGLAAVYVFPSVYERPEFTEFYDRLANTFFSLSQILAGQADDPTQRYGLMLNSLRVFLENPIIGAALGGKGEGAAGSGGHSSWMDALANYGLFGGVPFLLFHLLVFRRVWQAWRGDRRNALYWGCLLSCALYLFYGWFNIITQGTTISLFLYATAAGGKRSKDPASRQGLVWVHRTVNR